MNMFIIWNLASCEKGEIAVDTLKEILQEDFHSVLSLEIEHPSGYNP